MAGEKLSPRQRMIGMMYLVLTALLALQVTSSVLDRFYFLDMSLQRQVDETEVKNSALVSGITAEVEEKGKKKEDVAVLEKANLVRQKTRELQDYMTGLKDELTEKTGGEDENGKPTGAKNEDETANIMIRQKKGDELQKKLNDYAAFLGQELDDPKGFPKLAYDGKDHPIFSKDPEQKKKPFAELNFQSTPMVAALATITQFETEVMTYETKALNNLAQMVGAKEVDFDQLNVRVIPKSSVVAAGAIYEADMFIAASSSYADLKMYKDGAEIPVEAGYGKVKFKASPAGGKYDKDNVMEKKFKAVINMNDSNYTADISYFVARPVIQVQSASVQALYLGCGNELNVQVPALGTTYNPSFSASGASVIPGAKKGLVTVVPNAAKVALTVRSSGDMIGTENFGVRRVPKPTIEVRVSGKPVNMRTGLKTSRMRSLDIKAIADESFAQFLPKDARYRVTKWRVTLARGSRPVGQPKNVTSEKVNLSDFAARARPGDRLVIEVVEVKRMNFRGATENVNLGTVAMNVPLVE